MRLRVRQDYATSDKWYVESKQWWSFNWKYVDSTQSSKNIDGCKKALEIASAILKPNIIEVVLWPEPVTEQVSNLVPWNNLTQEEILKIVEKHTFDDQGYEIWTDGEAVAVAVQTALKIKNTLKG